jgi:hypothetical protein
VKICSKNKYLSCEHGDFWGLLTLNLPEITVEIQPLKPINFLTEVQLCYSYNIDLTK